MILYGIADDDLSNLIIQNIKISTDDFHQNCLKDEPERGQFQADVQAHGRDGPMMDHDRP